MSANQSNMLILQENASGSMVVYALVDIPAMLLILNGGDSTYVALLPSGSSSSQPVAKLMAESVETVNNLILCTIKKIKNALQCNTRVSYWVSLLVWRAIDEPE
ncbi:hypothetical protein EJB05_00912, partial [Eragrostis curvula]